MFCPLCKAEFREGFTQCSDCHIPLVAMQEEADQQAIAHVWKGGDASKFESVLDALHDAKIAIVFRERLNPRIGFSAMLAGIGWHTKRTSDTEFEIKILARDLDQAREAVRQALGEESCRGVRYCPACRASYLEGFTRCSDCGVALAEVLPAISEPWAEAAENERPDLARTPVFLAWFVPFSVFLLSIFALYFRPVVRSSPIFVIFLFLEIPCAIWGTLWMIYQSLRYERHMRRYFFLSLIPFVFVWYWLVRVPRQRERQSRFSAFS